MLKKFFSVIFIVVIVVGIIFFLRKIGSTAGKIILHTSPELLSTNGRTNIVLLGIGSANHDGPNLTDTIIFASLDKKKNVINLISIPRDLWISSLGQSGEKINEAYADGQLEGQGKGLLLTKALVGNIMNQPVHYGFRIDFDGFVKAVDLVGGLDVQVAHTLDDYNYPIDGEEDNTCGHTSDEITTFTSTASADQDFWTFFPCRYKHLHVDAGLQHMDGTLALEFVRSRHGAGIEGSDFARSRRQQEVIEAFKAKIFSLGILLNPSKLMGLYNILQSSIDTDIKNEDIPLFISLAQSLKNAKIETAVLDYGDYTTGRAGLLKQPPISSDYNYASVLIPRLGANNYSEIQAFVICELSKGDCQVSQTPIPTVAPTK